MDFTDFAWNCCEAMNYDCEIHEYVWCCLTDDTCKASTCPKIEEAMIWLSENNEEV